MFTSIWLDHLWHDLSNPALEIIDGDGAVDDSRQVEAARMAAYRLAVSLGNCRIFGVQVPEDLDGALSTAVALAAVEHLVGRIDRAADEAEDINSRPDEAGTLEEMDRLASILEERMDAWAAVVAAQEADPDEQLKKALVRVSASLQRLDETLCQPDNLQRLSELGKIQLLSNWRKLIKNGPYGDQLPWWLDGRLEAACED